MLAVTIGVAALLGELLEPLQGSGRGNQFLVAAGVLLEGGSHAGFTSHRLVPFNG